MKQGLQETADNSKSLTNEDFIRASFLPRITGNAHTVMFQSCRKLLYYSRCTDILMYRDNIQKNHSLAKKKLHLTALHQSVAINTDQKLYVKGANRQHIPVLVFQYIQNHIFLGLITGLAIPL